MNPNQLPTSYGNVVNTLNSATRDRGSIDQYLQSIQGKYGAADVNGIAQNLSNNTGGVSYQELQARLNSGVGAAPQDYAGQYQKLLSQIQAASGPAAPPSLDFAGIQARARKSAEGDINPLYTKMFNDFLTTQQTALGRTQEDIANSNKLIDQALADSQAQNATNVDRTNQDAATGFSNVAQASDNFQTNDAANFNNTNQAINTGVANSGLAGSGLGAQQVSAAIQQRNTASGQQQQQFDSARNQIGVIKGRSLADLATAADQAGKGATNAHANNAISLQRFIEDQATQKSQEADALRQQQLAAIQSTQANYAKGYYADLLKTNPNYSAYAGLF